MTPKDTVIDYGGRSSNHVVSGCAGVITKKGTVANVCSTGVYTCTVTSFVFYKSGIGDSGGGGRTASDSTAVT